MSLKKIIIILIALSLCGAGFYLFQKNRQQAELKAHNLKKFEILRQNADKSSAAGLLAMASAIKTYHQKNGRYPKTLMALYPEQIPDKIFISDLNWHYQAEKNDFLLERKAEDENVIASMHADMRLKTRLAGSGPAFASVQTPKDKQKKAGTKAAETAAQKPQVAALNSAGRRKIEKPKKETIPPVRIVKTELGKDEKFLLTLAGRNLYIWKAKDGTIGFSNIQYPEQKELTIFRENSWVEYRDNKAARQ